MNADEALLAFLGASLIGRKRDRVLDFVRRPAARHKFIDLLHHQLGAYVLPECVVADLPTLAWSLPAFRFSPPRAFGSQITSLRAAFAETRQPEVVITTDARFGYWRDETYVDLTVLINASQRLRSVLP